MNNKLIKYSLTSIASIFGTADAFTKIVCLTQEIDQINTLISYDSWLCSLCYCGAIVDSTIVLYCKHNAACFILTNSINRIHGYLIPNLGTHYKILIKIRPIIQ
jgi:hypothetical protein